jgi:uncharacterized membrane protein YphA (DoxX/SURF4 family)
VPPRAPTGATRWPGDLLPGLALVARLALAGVLLTSGTIKLLDPDGSVRAVRAYRLLPDGLAQVVGYGLPAVEVGLGLLLLVGLTTRLAAVGAGVLMLAFTAGIASAWARGLSIDCGCFGGGGDVEPGTASYGWPLLRDAGLALAAALLVWRPRTVLSVDARTRTHDTLDPLEET